MNDAKETSLVTLANAVALGSEIMIATLGVETSDVLGGKVITHAMTSDLMTSFLQRKLQAAVMQYNGTGR